MMCMKNVCMYFAGRTVFITMEKISDSNSGFLKTDKEAGGFCLRTIPRCTPQTWGGVQ